MNAHPGTSPYIHYNTQHRTNKTEERVKFKLYYTFVEPHSLTELEFRSAIQVAPNLWTKRLFFYKERMGFLLLVYTYIYISKRVERPKFMLVFVNTFS